MSEVENDDVYIKIAQSIINAYDCYDTWYNNADINKLIEHNNNKLSYIRDDKQRKSCALGITYSLYNIMCKS